MPTVSLVVVLGYLFADLDNLTFVASSFSSSFDGFSSASAHERGQVIDKAGRFAIACLGLGEFIDL